MPDVLKKWLESLNDEQADELNIYLEGEDSDIVVEDMLDVIISKGNR